MSDVAKEPCRWCGGVHGVMCPFVKAFEFDAENKITRVEFLTPSDFHPTKVSPTGQPPDTAAYPTLGTEPSEWT